MESTLSSARVTAVRKPFLLIRRAVVPNTQVSASHTAHILTENTQFSEISAKPQKSKAFRFAELTVVVNEVKTPPSRTHTVKHFYASSHREEPITHSPLPESSSITSYSFLTDISPTPSHKPDTPSRESTSSSPEPMRSSTKRVIWKSEEPDSELQKRKMKDFGKWICLGEKGFLKRPTRKTY